MALLDQAKRQRPQLPALGELAVAEAQIRASLFQQNDLRLEFTGLADVGNDAINTLDCQLLQRQGIRLDKRGGWN
jgi:hypothetical protein